MRLAFPLCPSGAEGDRGRWGFMVFFVPEKLRSPYSRNLAAAATASAVMPKWA